MTKFLASADFEKLDQKQKDTYYTKIVESNPSPQNFRSRTSELSEEERDRLRRNAGPIFEKAMEKRVDEYFAQPPEKRDEYMDKMIDQMQAGFRGGQGGMAFRGPDDAGGRGEGGMRQRPDRPPADASATAPASADTRGRRNTQRNGVGDGTGANPGAGNTNTAVAPSPPGDNSNLSRVDRRRLHMQSTPPAVRAKFVEFRKQLHKRMEERRAQAGSNGGTQQRPTGARTATAPPPAPPRSTGIVNSPR